MSRLSVTPTAIPDVLLVHGHRHEDARGTFERLYCRDSLMAHGARPCDEQWSLATNRYKGTLRGLHFQATPHGESKLVRCLQGALFDVAVDLRPGHAGTVVTVELTPENGQALYLPPGVAHGFQTLADQTQVLYGISPAYRAEAARGVRWNDPALAIPWPLPPVALSERDQALPDLSAVLAAGEAGA